MRRGRPGASVSTPRKAAPAPFSGHVGQESDRSAHVPAAVAVRPNGPMASRRSCPSRPRPLPRWLLAVSPEGRDLYLLRADGPPIYVVDTQTGQIAGTLATSVIPFGILHVAPPATPKRARSVVAAAATRSGAMVPAPRRPPAGRPDSPCLRRCAAWVAGGELGSATGAAEQRHSRYHKRWANLVRPVCSATRAGRSRQGGASARVVMARHAATLHPQEPVDREHCSCSRCYRLARRASEDRDATRPGRLDRR